MTKTLYIDGSSTTSAHVVSQFTGKITSLVLTIAGDVSASVELSTVATIGTPNAIARAKVTPEPGAGAALVYVVPLNGLNQKIIAGDSIYLLSSANVVALSAMIVLDLP